MDWTQQVDNYCERTDFSYWSEPVNAVTNAAFLIAALLAYIVAARLGRERDPGIIALLIILTAIGIGSYLFHTHATGWAGAADVIPILLYILTYIFLATTRFFDLAWWWGLAAVVLFFPYAAGVLSGLSPLTGDLNGSIGYIPVPILITLYALALWRKHPGTAQGLLIGVAILTLSLTFRTVDEAVCNALPLGTHFMWHILNGAMLGWMIVVMARHPRTPIDAAQT